VPSAGANDCQWSEWGVWSECTGTCDVGYRVRTRTVVRPAQPGGLPCVGDSQMAESCGLAPCLAPGQSATPASGAPGTSVAPSNANGVSPQGSGNENNAAQSSGGASAGAWVWVLLAIGCFIIVAIGTVIVVKYVLMVPLPPPDKDLELQNRNWYQKLVDIQ